MGMGIGMAEQERQGWMDAIRGYSDEMVRLRQEVLDREADARALAEALEQTVQLAMLSDAADEAVDGIADKARAALRRPGVRKVMGR